MNEKLINQAFLFTAKHFDKGCHNNNKPVYFHSIKVAMLLFEYGYNETIVVGAILHDLLEDTKATKADISLEFGEETAKLVEALSFSAEIEDRFLQSKAMIDKTREYGKEACIIKCADLFENGKYFHLVTNQETKNYLIKKWNYFVNICEPILKDEKIFALLKKQVAKMK
ncbi:MAG: HD domain-containing protein [Erysipelotrichales bacterium]|nr:HD domain-containing protein [Erysipelotrichales bacterium]